MIDSICLEFEKYLVPNKNILIPETNEGIKQNICVISSCGCCWEVYLPIKYEFDYREWLYYNNIIVKSVNYINKLLCETCTWLMLDTMQKELEHVLSITDFDNTIKLDNHIWILKYCVNGIPDTIIQFQYPSSIGDIYKKAIQYFINTYDTYKDFLQFISNWSISNNIITKKTNSYCATIPNNLDIIDSGTNTNNKIIELFELLINGKCEVKCLLCINNNLT